MTIGELADQAGVTSRTIRYYVEQGLLPAPEYGRPAEYTDEHLRRLDLIRRLKDQYLPLEEIRDIMQRLTLDQVEELANESAPVARKAAANPLTSAADYIAGVLGRGAAREQMKQQAPPPMPPAVPPPYTAPPPGATVPPGWPPAPTQPPAPAQPAWPAPDWTPPGTVPPVPPAAPVPAVPLPVPLVPMPSPPADKEREESTLPAQIAPTTWQRIALAPGIELHVAITGDARQNRLVARLVEAAGRILATEPEKEGE